MANGKRTIGDAMKDHLENDEIRIRTVDDEDSDKEFDTFIVVEHVRAEQYSPEYFASILENLGYEIERPDEDVEDMLDEEFEG